MIKVQIYIEDKLIDLYGDENIEVTSTLQDIRDVGKVFTDFSQSFKVPASASNNIVFGHFYNNNITTGGYDTRNKKSAKIFINYIEFRKGYIQLNGVQMKNNKPSSYDISFYGSTVRLKDLIKEDKLTALCDINKDYNLSNYNHEYSNSIVKNHFSGIQDYTVNGDTKSGAVIYPLITGKKRLFYDSTLTTEPENFSGNLYDGTSDTTRGLEFIDLKPAIKAIHVIEAIEGHYGIEFTRDFFDTEAFTPLYMWLSSASGNIIDYKFTGKEMETIQVTDIGSPDSVGNWTVSDNDTIDFTIAANPYGTRLGKLALEVEVTPITTDQNYTIKAIDTITGDVLSEINGSGTQTLKRNFKYAQQYASRDYSIKFVVETYDNISFTARTRVYKRSGNTQGTPTTDDSWYDANNGASFSTIPEILMERHLPEMKVIDFLSGIFKMFNLIAFFIDDETDADFGKIKVMALDAFYADAPNNRTKGLVDIQKYVDTTQHYVQASLPYTTIEFKYEETNTITMEHHTQDYNKVFGNSEYTPDDYTDSGKKYEIKLPFSHMKYEHLLDLGDDFDTTGLQYGYAAGGSFNPDTGNYSEENIKPLLFYGILTNGTNGLVDSINWISGTRTSITQYWRPSNSNKTASQASPAPHNINFDVEFEEFYLTDYSSVFEAEEDTVEQQSPSNTLFKKFYSNYIISSLNPTKRIVKMTAYFPASLLVKYKMNDQFKILDDIYRINSIKTSITTGKTTLELLSLNTSEIAQ